MWQQGDADVCAHESIQQCSNTKTKNMKETWSNSWPSGFSVTQKGKILIKMKQLSFDSEIKQTFTIVCFLWTCQCYASLDLIPFLSACSCWLQRWRETHSDYLDGCCVLAFGPALHDFIWLKMQRLKVFIQRPGSLSLHPQTSVFAVRFLCF